MSLAVSRRREFEVEKAWAIHEPERTAVSVPLSARRSVRVFRAMITGDAAVLRRAYQSPSFRRLIADFTKPGALGRDKKLLAIRKALAPASVERVGGALIVTWIAPHGNMPVNPEYPSLSQAGVVVSIAHVTRLGPRAFPALEVSDHALGRCFQRCPGVNMRAALVEAARAYLSADWNDVEAAWRERRTLYLPAGKGVLLATPLAGPSRDWLIARASTWVSSEARGEDQVPVGPAADPSKSVLAAAVGSSATPPAACGASRSEGPGAASRVRFD